MPLTGSQLQKLHKAISSAFSGPDLEQLLRFELNERLHNVVSSGSSFSQVVFELIQWAERYSKTEQLIQAVQRARPENAEIQALGAELSPAPPEPAAGTARLDGPRRARLRAALLDQFPTRSAIEILVDDTLSVNLNTIAAGSNLTETVFNLIQWASVDPVSQLRPLLTEAARQRPNSKELQALKTELFGS